jgi:hypothetical protein
LSRTLKLGKKGILGKEKARCKGNGDEKVNGIL